MLTEYFTNLIHFCSWNVHTAEAMERSIRGLLYTTAGGAEVPSGKWRSVGRALPWIKTRKL